MWSTDNPNIYLLYVLVQLMQIWVWNIVPSVGNLFCFQIQPVSCWPYEAVSVFSSFCKKKKLLIFTLWTLMFCLCVSMCTTGMQCLRTTEEGISNPRRSSSDSHELLYECREPRWSSLQEQLVLLTAELLTSPFSILLLRLACFSLDVDHIPWENSLKIYRVSSFALSLHVCWIFCCCIFVPDIKF